MYKVLDKDTIKSEILLHLPVAKTWICLEKVTWQENFQYMLCKVKAAFQCHIMREKQRALLYVSYVLTSTWACLCRETKKNVFVKPNVQCRACSNIVMARKRTFRGARKERALD